MYITVIGWLASFTTAILGLPMVINAYKSKEIKSASIISWWIYFLGVLIYLIYGSSLQKAQIIVTELLNGLITFLFVILFSFYYKTRILPTWFKLINVLFCLLIIIGVIVISVLFFLKIYVNIDENGQYIISFIGTSFLSFSFLPQTIIAIRKKTLVYAPFFFIHDLIVLNIFWIIFLGHDILSQSNLWVAFILQVIGFAISIIQGVFYYIQIFSKKTNPSRKIVWI